MKCWKSVLNLNATNSDITLFHIQTTATFSKILCMISCKHLVKTLQNDYAVSRDVNRKPEIRFSVLKPKSGFRFWKPNFEFIFLIFLPMENCKKMRVNFWKDWFMHLHSNECNYAGRARKIYSWQFPHIGSFDLFRPNEAFYNVLTSAYIDGLRGRQRHCYRYMVQL